MTAWRHQVRLVEEHVVPDDREQNILTSAPSLRWKSHLNLFVPPDDDVIVVFVIDLRISLILCTLVLTSSATMSKWMTKCPQNVNMTRTAKQDDQIWLLIWIWTFEVSMHLSMRHMTMTATETTWWLWAWKTASLFWLEPMKQWGWISWQKLVKKMGKCPSNPIFSNFCICRFFFWGGGEAQNQYIFPIFFPISGRRPETPFLAGGQGRNNNSNCRSSKTLQGKLQEIQLPSRSDFCDFFVQDGVILTENAQDQFCIFVWSHLL